MAASEALSPRQFHGADQHPRLNPYRDGGMGGDDNHSVVGYVPTHLLTGIPGNTTHGGGEVVDKYRAALRSGQGFENPLMVIHDPKTKATYVGEGNHRLRAAVEEGHTHVPVRVVRGRVGEPGALDDGGHAKAVDPGPSPWKGALGEDYWPSDIHPKHLWPGEDVR